MSLIGITRACLRRFCASKHFVDSRLQNMSLRANDRMGVLQTISKCITDLNINLTYIRSNVENVNSMGNRKFVINLSLQTQDQNIIKQLTNKLNQSGIQATLQKPIPIAWFPRNYAEIDLIGKVLMNVEEVQSKDHPSLSDSVYRKRRDLIASIGINWKMGEPIPIVQYSEEEQDLWKRINRTLAKLHRQSMSERYLHQMNKLNKTLKVDQRIPQLSQLNDYLQRQTKFSIKPTAGILSQREFLNAFAFRTFCSTQYLRHPSVPDYTPEPDIVHEIIGHIPMFADPDIAELSHRIGLLSLGANDEQIAELGALYWFTLEFGACKENGKLRGYGAGVASSISQMENLLSNKPKFEKLDPHRDSKRTFPVQTVQPTYLIVESFEECLSQFERFGAGLLKETTTSFNFETNTVDYDRSIEGIFTEDKGPKF